MHNIRSSLQAKLCFGAATVFAVGSVSYAQAADRAFGTHARDAAIHLYQYHEDVYRLEPGPHLFIDWRYVCAGYNPYYTYKGKGIPRDRPPDYSAEINSQIAFKPRNAPFGLRLEAVRPEKIGPVIKPDRPWEFFTPYVNLIHANGKYMLFYNTTTFREGKGYVVCYAESTDGIHYTKPNLGVVEFEGSKQNNIVLGPGVCKYEVIGSGLFVDPHAPPEERFKAIYMTVPDPQVIARLKERRPESVTAMGIKHKCVVMGAVSPDGIRWRELEEPLLAHMSDTGTTAYWDEKLQRYVGYFRMAAMERRAIGRAETTDFRRWPAPEMILWPQPGEESFVDYYTNGKSVYPGTQTMHLMFPMIYHRNIDTSMMRMASSLDGCSWGFLPGGNIMGPGNVGEFDAGCIFPGAGLAEIPGDRVALPYCGFALPHKFPRLGPLGEVALAVWPKERLAALVADGEAYFATIRLSTQGSSLWLNFETQYNGSIQVEVEGVEGRRFAACDPLSGNHLKKQVTWNGEHDLGIKPGQQLVLEFRLRAARLYSSEIK